MDTTEVLELWSGVDSQESRPEESYRPQYQSVAKYQQANTLKAGKLASLTI